MQFLGRNLANTIDSMLIDRKQKSQTEIAIDSMLIDRKQKLLSKVNDVSKIIMSGSDLYLEQYFREKMPTDLQNMADKPQWDFPNSTKDLTNLDTLSQKSALLSDWHKCNKSDLWVSSCIGAQSGQSERSEHL